MRQRSLRVAWGRLDGHVLLVVALGLAVGAVFVLRYSGLWSENDTSVFVRSTSTLMDAGTLDHKDAYPHGFAYPVWVAALTGFTGESIGTLTAEFLPVVAGLLISIMGYIAFRRMLGNPSAGLLAVGVLFLTPELVFTAMRGNHEKLTVSLTLMATMVLLASFLELRERRRWSVFAAWVALLYALAFTLASLNSFFGSTFFLAVTAQLFFATVLLGLRRTQAAAVRRLLPRLMLVALTSWSIVILVMFFVYPPASGAIRTMSSATERVAALALSFEPTSDPYQPISTDWSNPWAYSIISSFRWILFGGSFAYWVAMVWALIKDPIRQPIRRLFLVSMYGAFGLQLALAIPIDLVGLAAGSNLQVRLYTYFTLFAAPVLAAAVTHFMTVTAGKRVHHVTKWAVAVALGAFAMLSITKATLEPAFSNRWLFYRGAEMEALRFWDSRHAQQTIWIGPDGRLRHGYVMAFGDRLANKNSFVAFTVSNKATHALESEAVAASTAVWRVPPPSIWADNRTFDNGYARVYHRRPKTPFQR